MSVDPSVRHTQVEFREKYAEFEQNSIENMKQCHFKDIQTQVCGQFARTHLLSELCLTCFPILETFKIDLFFYKSLTVTLTVTPKQSFNFMGIMIFISFWFS